MWVPFKKSAILMLFSSCFCDSGALKIFFLLSRFMYGMYVNFKFRTLTKWKLTLLVYFVHERQNYSILNNIIIIFFNQYISYFWGKYLFRKFNSFWTVQILKNFEHLKIFINIPISAIVFLTELHLYIGNQRT